MSDSKCACASQINCTSIKLNWTLHKMCPACVTAFPISHNSIRAKRFRLLPLLAHPLALRIVLFIIYFDKEKYIPIKWDRHQCEYGCSDRYVSHEIIHRTVNTAERPIGEEHIDEVEHTIQSRHEKIRHTQIEKIIIGCCSHLTMCCVQKRINRVISIWSVEI